MPIMTLTSNFIANNTQYYLNQANNSLQSSVNKLASGNAIDKASDNVAGLAIGTVLQANVNTLKSALNNVSQAQTMLSVADGSLRTDINILSRLKSLATQATSGSLSTQAYSFLNQEFNNLVQQIDQIASTTKFNGINLIDGSLYVPSKLTSNVTSNNVTAQATVKFNTAFSSTTGSNHVFLNGASIAFANAQCYNTLSANDQLTYIDTTANSTNSAQASALYNKIQSLLDYGGTNAYLIGVKQQLSAFSYSFDGTQTFTITSKAAGTLANGNNTCTNYAVGADGTATGLLVNGGNAGSKTVSTSVAIGFSDPTNNYNPVAIGYSGNLTAGSFPGIGGTTYNCTSTTYVQGTVGNGAVAVLAPTSQATTGIDVSSISDNPSFVGAIQGFKATYVSSNVVDLSINVGGITYEASTVNTAFASGNIIRFASIGSTGGHFSINMTATTYSVASQSDANNVSAALNQAFNGVNFYQKRTLSSFTPSTGYVIDASSNKVGDLTSATMKLINSNFNGLQVSDVQVIAPVNGATNSTIKVVLSNGEIYQSGYDQYGVSSALGSNIASATPIGLVSTTNPNNMMVFTVPQAATTTLKMDTASSAAAVQTALKAAFGINSGASSIIFQVGLTAQDNIPIQIQSARTASLFLDSLGNTITPDLLSLTSAQTAGPVIDNALSSITSVLANIGALQSRFNYAAANLNIAIQNQDAARGAFLDTDIPSESSNFAQNQVRVQAAVAVLAQANQIPNVLLSLLQK